MTPTQLIRERLPDIKNLNPNLVAVFVGGTSGIGESTARELIRYSVSPRVYLIGRSPEQAARIEAEFHQLNPSSKVEFIRSDVSQLRNVDSVCEQIKTQEKRINVLFLSAGIFHLRGREETPEGLDRKLALDFYSRLRFTENLLPLLRLARSGPQADPDTLASAPEPDIASVISVLGGGKEASIDISDLSLKRNYTLDNSTKHAITMTTLAFDHLTTLPENSGISFIHTHPGMVKTNGDRELGSAIRFALGIFTCLFKGWTVPVKECGERHLWVATEDIFGTGGLYTIGQGSDNIENSKVLNKLKQDGVSKEVWTHTREVFQNICESNEGRY